jgi:hypothetical protein
MSRKTILKKKEMWRKYSFVWKNMHKENRKYGGGWCQKLKKGYKI